MCPTTSTAKGAIPDKPEWNEMLEFDVPITELPRSAKLCFVIYQQRQPGRKSKEVNVKLLLLKQDIVGIGCSISLG